MSFLFAVMVHSVESYCIAFVCSELIRDCDLYRACVCVNEIFVHVYGAYDGDVRYHPSSGHAWGDGDCGDACDAFDACLCVSSHLLLS